MPHWQKLAWYISIMYCWCMRGSSGCVQCDEKAFHGSSCKLFITLTFSQFLWFERYLTQTTFSAMRRFLPFAKLYVHPFWKHFALKFIEQDDANCAVKSISSSDFKISQMWHTESITLQCGLSACVNWNRLLFLVAMELVCNLGCPISCTYIIQVYY